MHSLHIGLLINPLAGLGGSLGRKGSDGQALREIAGTLTPEQQQRSRQRAVRALACLTEIDGVTFSTATGAMGAQTLEELGLVYREIQGAGPATGTAADTRAAALALRDAGIDLLVFVGGDGTARDVFDVVGQSLPVLGVPAGVKMHSGVFAVSPEAAGELLLALAQGGLVGLSSQEVRDIDEEAFREDVVRSRFYGDMLVPGEGRYLQHTKMGGRESQELVAAEIAAWVAEQMQSQTCYLIGPGSTTAALMQELGLDNTLLGVDAVVDGEVICSDANETDLLALLARHHGPVCIVVTAIGGQGHIFGRGNQQFSPAVIRAAGIDSIVIVAAKSKISSLAGRPLLVDTNDPVLDTQLCGYREVITGYDDRILYPVGRLPHEETI